jgi:hypothetical protein
VKYKRMANENYRVIPVKPLGPSKIEEKKEFKRIIHEISRINGSFLERGAGKKQINPVTKEQEYFDVPNFSYKLYQRNGKIHQYTNMIKDPTAQSRLKMALQEDIQSIRLIKESLELPKEHLHAFAIQGLPQQYAIHLDREFYPQMKKLFRSIGKDPLLYSMTLKEVENHQRKRSELSQRLAGLKPDNKKAMLLHYVRNITLSSVKGIYNFVALEETKEKHREYQENFQARMEQLFPKKTIDKNPLSKRKLSEKNQYMQAEILFLIWTADLEKAQRFQSELQQLMEEMQGENNLQVIPVKLDLSRVTKGLLQYGDIPQLCLYQRELNKFLYLPSVNEIDDSFYYENEQKTEIPSYAMGYETGALALGKRMDTEETISMPRATTETDLDDRGTPTIISGKKGSGKTQLLINQVADTFCLGASSRQEWKGKSRSTVVIDVADGDMLREIYELVPKELHDRVIILNHADLENPIPITNHDILNINQVDGLEEEIASMETEMLMDSLKDKGSTIAVERYFKMALQASYIAGKGNIIDAMKIIEDPNYRDEISSLLDEGNQVFLPSELRKMDVIFDDPKSLETIDNRISRLKNTQPWIDALAQEPTEGMDFWKWINGDENGAYLVLIYIPKRINKSFRSFLFAHYLMKLWYMTEAREIINKADRREFLVIVDELHQIFGHRVVPIVLEAIHKEARKYRGRFVFTIHGWSSIKDKEIKDTIKDSSGNYIMLKGGDDMFSSLEKEFRPYHVADFNNLMKLGYCGLFKVDIKKITHVFQAKLMESASVRFKKQRHVTLETFRAKKNKYGRSKQVVRAAMKKKGETACQKQAPVTESNLVDELETIISG